MRKHKHLVGWYAVMVLGLFIGVLFGYMGIVFIEAVEDKNRLFTDAI